VARGLKKMTGCRDGLCLRAVSSQPLGVDDRIPITPGDRERPDGAIVIRVKRVGKSQHTREQLDLVSSRRRKVT